MRQIAMLHDSPDLLGRARTKPLSLSFRGRGHLAEVNRDHSLLRTPARAMRARPRIVKIDLSPSHEEAQLCPWRLVVIAQPLADLPERLERNPMLVAEQRESPQPDHVAKRVDTSVSSPGPVAIARLEEARLCPVANPPRAKTAQAGRLVKSERQQGCHRCTPTYPLGSGPPSSIDGHPRGAVPQPARCRPGVRRASTPRGTTPRAGEDPVYSKPTPSAGMVASAAGMSRCARGLARARAIAYRVFAPAGAPRSGRPLARAGQVLLCTTGRQS